METLVVNNDTDTWEELLALADRCGLALTPVHCRSVTAEQANNHDLVILSGGYWYDDESQHLETYRQELDLIRRTTTPVIGICLGMQLMHVAFNGEVPLLDAPQSGPKHISITPVGQTLFGLPDTLEVQKNHTRGVLSAGTMFDVLGASPGHIEIIKHVARPLLGVQFHPEVGDQAIMTPLFQKLVSTVVGLRTGSSDNSA